MNQQKCDMQIDSSGWPPRVPTPPQAPKGSTASALGHHRVMGNPTREHLTRLGAPTAFLTSLSIGESVKERVISKTGL